jgi:hypothetical protein
LSAGWFAACEVLNTIKVRAFRQYRKKRWNRCRIKSKKWQRKR